MKLSRLVEKARRRFTAPSADPSASTKEGLERRRSARSRLDCTVELLDAAARPADGAVHLVDMSGVGLGIASSRDFSVGQAMGVRFNAGRRTVAATARVRWARPEGVLTTYGLEFEGVGAWDRLRLRQASRPGGLDPDEAVNFLLQVGAAVTAAGVLADWLVSDPARQAAAEMFFPYFALLGAAALAAWFIAASV